MLFRFPLPITGLILLLGIHHTAVAQQTTFTSVAPGCYVHTTYANHYPANGLLVRTEAGAVLIDAGWNAKQAQEIQRWVHREWHQPITLCIVSHCHIDRMGGAGWLQSHGVRVVSTALTAQKMEAVGYPWAAGILPVDTTLTVGRQTFQTYFPGAGHAPDNIVVWLPEQKILVGGCLIKSIEAKGLGNLSDANLTAWAPTIRRVMARFSGARLVIPGHQVWGDPGSLQHTLELLKAAGH